MVDRASQRASAAPDGKTLISGKVSTRLARGIGLSTLVIAVLPVPGVTA
jgi:hypothetical protein